MTQAEQTQLFEKLVDRMRGTMLKKGNDYATADRLSNFKQTGYITNLPPAKTTLALCAVKISRMSSLLDSGKKPENEAIEDTARDLCCYAILNYMVMVEDGIIKLD